MVHGACLPTFSAPFAFVAGGMTIIFGGKKDMPFSFE